MQYKKVNIHCTNGYLAVLKAYAVIGGRDSTITRVKLFRIAPNLEGGYQHCPIPRYFEIYGEHQLRMVEGNLNLTMKLASPMGIPSRRRCLVFRYSLQTRRTSWRLIMRVVGGFCGKGLLEGSKQPRDNSVTILDGTHEDVPPNPLILRVEIIKLMIKNISPYKFKHFYNHNKLQDLDHSTKERKKERKND
ncbi:hypothetical protein L1987_49993 [Smallanthus sonchifolius]|uniref:Uncharacterized protein n=1 Tax=Smallanthus sonchifolius TaxID=185202 RepID=A0ACB9FW93_9ASTR|nr:hypothetical protein L1987_49993 [Smallanthus sonchifolius]